MNTLRGLFVSSTGTSEGKTVISCAIVHALRSSGMRVAALKPIETGCEPSPLDAQALAQAAADPALADHDAWYRATLPAAPYAVELECGQPAPRIEMLRDAIVSVAAAYDGALVEGAGGLYVPLTRALVIADLVHALDLPVVMVAQNRLGVLSHVLAATEAAAHRGLRIAAVVLNAATDDPVDASARTNRSILSERLQCPVIDFPNVSTHSAAALADAAASSGLLRIALAELDNV